MVFLFCATAFGVVLTLGGLRYSSVETEIYLLTTNLLDLQAAAALSIVQLLAITALLVVTSRLRAVADPSLARTTARPPRVVARRLAEPARDGCWWSCWSGCRSPRWSPARCRSATAGGSATTGR